MFTLALSRVDYINLVYLLAAVLFIVGLKMLSKVSTARQGNLVSATGMLLATIATFFFITGGQWFSLVWVTIAMIVGAAIGYIVAVRVPMTGMPQMVALLNGFGGMASLLVASAEYAAFTNMDLVERLQAHVNAPPPGVVIGQEAHAGMLAMYESMPPQELAQWEAFAAWPWYALFATGLAVFIGGVTFTGSLMAFGKLQGSKWAPDRPVQFTGQKAMIAGLLGLSLLLAVVLIFLPTWWPLLILIVAAALILGVLLVIGIGGADMPVVVALLNSYSGLAAAFAGFALNNYALIITGSLVGASGLILTNIMCKAMNRSLTNVLFGGVGGSGTSVPVSGGGAKGSVREFTMEDAGIVLDAARQVMLVPGYGMAVAQAQHAVKELGAELERRGITVRYAIHPVAGRMPGHMNVLLAEAGVPYEQLLDLDHANAEFDKTDVALVIGANDVTNPAARHAKDSPIYGMPILDVDKARTVFVIKRSMRSGFAGIENELYFHDNCGMLFGDAKKVVSDLTAELSAAGV
jgi:NAD(P) transhydrogenase subunit beta